MNWIESIGEAIDYIEENLTNELKTEDIARKALISPFYFQKAFGLLCGFSVGEYIRSRRLAEAGKDLLTTDERIIDIAMKYGYESHDSFTKAFTRFHGCTPTAVRRNGHMIKTYAPLKLNLLLKGGYIMDYRIEKHQAFSVEAKIDRTNKTVTFIDDDTLPAFSQLSLAQYMSCEFSFGSVYSVDKSEVESMADYERLDVPAVSWAVFKCSGVSRKDARENTLLRIKNEWFPQTNYEMLSPNYVMVNYASEDDDGNLGEIMIAIKDKNA